LRYVELGKACLSALAADLLNGLEAARNTAIRYHHIRAFAGEE
jgi:hypothetical protein